jgi:hypothetical protein
MEVQRREGDSMHRVTLASLVIVVLVAMLFPLSAQSMGTTKLTGTVGPGFSITLKKGSKMVKTLKAGKYTFVITDKSALHNFTLKQIKGGTFMKTLTGTAFTGTKTVTLTLKKGSWKAFCTVHPTQVVRTFTVTS